MIAILSCGNNRSPILLAICTFLEDVTVGFDETEFTVPENEGPATLNVTTLSGALGTSVYLKLRSVDGTAKGTSLSFYTLSCTRMSPENTHKLMGFYTEFVILGVIL